MKEKLYFAGIIISIISILGLVSVLLWKINKFSDKQASIEKSVITQKQLDDSIVRSQSQYISKKDLEDWAKTNNLNLKAIKDDLSKLDAKVDGINVTKITTIPVYIKDGQSTKVEPGPKIEQPKCKDGTECPNQDPNAYLSSTNYFQLNEKFQNITVPWGMVGFSGFSTKPWSLETFKRQYQSSTIIAHDEDGRIIPYTKFSITTNGKTYDITTDKSEFVQVYPDPKFYWWNPKMFIGMDAGYALNNGASSSVTLGFAPFAYGKTKQNPEFVFAQVFGGYDIVRKDFVVGISPFMWGLGSSSKLFSNTYIGPRVGYEFLNKNLTISVGVSLSF